MEAIARIAKGTCVLLLFSVGMTRGEIITIGLIAEVSYMEESAAELLEYQLSLADTITGYYTYDSDTPDSSALETVGLYWHYASPCGIALNGGGFNFQSDPDNIEFRVGIGEDHDDHDTYSLISYTNLPLSNGAEVGHIWWYLHDWSCSALSSDALPLGPPVLSDWQYQGLSIELGPKGGANIGAQVTSVWLIPEPATVLLLGCGSVLILRKRRTA